MNTGCEPAMFVAAFNDEDPGVDSIAQRCMFPTFLKQRYMLISLTVDFGLPIDIVGATLGGLGVKQVEGLAALIPDNVAVGTDECLKRCGLTRPTTQPILQQQPRVAGNALP